MRPLLPGNSARQGIGVFCRHDGILMLEAVARRIKESAPFKELRSRVNSVDPGHSLVITGIAGSLLACVVDTLSEETGRQILVLHSERDLAEMTVDDCIALMGRSQIFSYVHSLHHESAHLDLSAPVAQIETLKALTEKRPVIVVASAEALASPIPSPELYQQRAFELAKDRISSFEETLARLNTLGFERKDFVEETGDFAVRGGILDIYPFVGDNPVRVEFWGDSIESIREFDVATQRSIRDLQSASVVANLTGSREEPDARVSLFEYFANDAIILVDEPASIERELVELKREGVEGIFEWADIELRLRRFPQIIHRRIVSGDADIALHAIPQPPFQGAIKYLLAHSRKLLQDGYEIILTCDTPDEALRLEELIEEELGGDSRESDDWPEPVASQEEALKSLSFDIGGQWNIIPETLHSGFLYPAAGMALFTEHQIFDRRKRHGRASKPRFRGFTQKEARQLRRGDSVVHSDYGIGAFDGLQTISVRGIEQDVMKLLYDEGDVLYVNLNFINRVQKYTSREGHVPKLTKLGSPHWDRLRTRARKRIKDIARELIRLYARRKLEPGSSFSPDSHWQKEMEASFMYEDTPDQAKASLDVKRDMQDDSPMDRLICGDVGFGKTEVAVRAAFKAVLDGKQVCLLVPTTILAQQHANTFRDRLSRYTVRTEALTRFRTKKEQTRILEDLHAGRLDVVIGTHRLLSKDVGFKDLGLLIVDEEHRFGVSSKEKIRQLRANVDTLTLTATPIPRTLQFSLLGARDLSIINTPPRNRLPIHTEITQFDLKLIREAILKELHRGGQVYFIHDRVHDIDQIQEMLERHIPEARFHIAHGQMKGHELEKTMMRFLEGGYDVLICTKIIESGIDIPSVNTIIVNRADRFGMAELYQLRGRVGRSNLQAYSYLLTPPLASLTRATLQRLQAIQEFAELGSGFNLALRDLEVRGAGNLLGAEQSGFILEMGFETYQRILEEAVMELKEEEFGEIFEKKESLRPKEQPETVIETDIEALIPSVYVQSDGERLDLYRRLFQLGKIEEIAQMRSELRDRFGEYPEEVEHLLLSIELRITAAQLGFRRIDLTGQMLTATFPPSDDTVFYQGTENTTAPFQLIMERVSALTSPKPHLKQENQTLMLRMSLRNAQPPADKLHASLQLLRLLAESLPQGIADSRPRY